MRKVAETYLHNASDTAAILYDTDATAAGLPHEYLSVEIGLAGIMGLEVSVRSPVFHCPLLLVGLCSNVVRGCCAACAILIYLSACSMVLMCGACAKPKDCVALSFLRILWHRTSFHMGSRVSRISHRVFELSARTVKDLRRNPNPPWA